MIFDFDNANNNDEIPKRNIHYTMVFTAFVFMTLFNEFNARKVHGERNVFGGVLSNYLFIGIWIASFIVTVSTCRIHCTDFDTFAIALTL